MPIPEIVPPVSTLANFDMLFQFLLKLFPQNKIVQVFRVNEVSNPRIENLFTVNIIMAGLSNSFLAYKLFT